MPPFFMQTGPVGGCSAPPLGLKPFGKICEYPWYYAEREEVIPGIPDKYTSLLSPIIVYWVMSLFFALLIKLNLRWIRSNIIHVNDASVRMNRVSLRDVVFMVFSQEVVQTLVGVFWFGEEIDPHGPKGPFRDHKPDIERLVYFAAHTLSASAFRTYGPTLIRLAYWYIIPVARLVFAAFVLDGWQYFWHRYFHVNTYLYKHVHSWHHRLYAPYAFGALYNHPLEGLILDTLGSGVAEIASGLSLRQTIIFFSISSAKTVDDHCGIRLKYDPLQFLFFNNCDYHDIHHQIIGLKYNFSQPFFIHFDYFFGTRMTREEFNERKYKRNGKIEDEDEKPPVDANESKLLDPVDRGTLGPVMVEDVVSDEKMD